MNFVNRYKFQLFQWMIKANGEIKLLLELRDRQCHVLTEERKQTYSWCKDHKVRFSSKVKPQAEVATMVKTKIWETEMR